MLYRENIVIISIFRLKEFSKGNTKALKVWLLFLLKHLASTDSEKSLNYYLIALKWSSECLQVLELFWYIFQWVSLKLIFWSSFWISTRDSSLVFKCLRRNWRICCQIGIKLVGMIVKIQRIYLLKKNHTDILLRAKDSNNFHLRKFLQPLVKHVYVPKIIYFETFPWILSFLIYFLFLILLCVCVR